MTVEEFHEWSGRPEYDDKHVELVRGRPVVMSLPDPRHGFVCSNLCWLLGNYTRERRQGYICLGAGFIAERNPDTVYAPDIALYARTLHYDELTETWGEIPPKLVVEVRAHEETIAYLLDKA